jgi:hypothetical protein
MNRRAHPRLLGPFPGSFKVGKGRAKTCRIADISLGGCFAITTEAALDDAPVTVTIDLDGVETISIAGTVVVGEWGHGFRVKFGPRTSVDVKVLEAVMTALRVSKKRRSLPK